MRILIVGASAGLGRALAEACAARGHHTVPIARDERDLAALAQHLTLTTGTRVEPIVWDLATPDPRPLAERVAGSGPLDGILLPAGAALDDDDGSLDPARAECVWRVNFASQAALVTALWPALLAAPRASVVGFGSVAAIRGRRRNVVYAASKRALHSYFESLRHLAVGSPINVRFYQLGYLDTQQTSGKRLPLPRASTGRLARRVLEDWTRDAGTVVYPAYWRAVGAVVRAMPWIVYRRLQF